jgi:hypothetical protein
MIWNIGFHGERLPATAGRVSLTIFFILLIMGFFQWMVYYYRVHLTVRFYEGGIEFKKRFKRRFVTWDEISKCRVKNRRWMDIRWPAGRLQLYWRGFESPTEVLGLLKEKVPDIELAPHIE